MIPMGRKSVVKREKRNIYVNEDPPKHPNGELAIVQRFPANEISTSKYTVVTFIPKNLFEQFRRVANLFFLTLTVLQFFPDYETINPFVAALPFVFIIFMTAIKDGVEDTRRHSSDRQINGQITHTLVYNNKNSVFQTQRDQKSVSPAKVTDASNAWKETKWEEVEVGDILLLKNNEPIPADILILNSSEPDGLCYVETKNLDGETNLKIRNGLLETAQVGKDTIEALSGYCFRIESEHPNPNLYTYTGTAVFQASAPDSSKKNITMAEFDPNEEIVLNQVKVPLNINSILLRGCVLRNTEWVIGVALYTGKDTKICLNSGGTPSKQSRIERTMNPLVVIQLFLLVILCLVICITSPIWEASHQPANPNSRVLWLASTYKGNTSFSTWLWIGFVAFWTSLILLQNIVPISLYLTIEVVKTIQSYFIYNDVQMYYEPLDQPCIPKSWNLSDDLGQIDYIFSDKTGTLTRNIMQFKKCSINGVVYGKGEHLEPVLTQKSVATKGSLSLAGIARKNATVKQGGDMSPGILNTDVPSVSVTTPSKNHHVSFMTMRNTVKKVNIDATGEGGECSDDDDDDLKFSDSLLTRELSNMNHPQYAPLRDFFTSLAVCHSVLISKDVDNPELFKYNAQSPDEAALVQAARDVGFVFKARSTVGLTVDVLGEDEQSELLNVIEFNSTRKRMSVIVKRPAGEIVLYCKGADSMIYERLASGQDMMKKITSKHLEEFAEDGLRTLCIAYKLISAETYSKWSEEYNQASTSLDSREQKMDEIAEKIETDLILMGATAIEDKLQEGVPECIKTLLSAGIKLWVLTGDKLETAINIGLSCNLLSKNMNLILVRGASEDCQDEAGEIKKQLSEALSKFFGVDEAEDASTKDRRFFKNVSKNNQNEPYALVIDGDALRYALLDDQRQLLLELGTRCAAVICCRVSPLQKAKVVELVKNSIQCTCLAIGDGANDVSMIQAAHIGVGIAGEEGLQAVMASDYAIAQFKYLKRLLLVHGHWSYVRTAEMILNFFFKNLVWSLALFWFQIYCGFSSGTAYDLTFMIFYNILLTSLPVGLIGIFDIDIGQEFTLAFPPLYKLEVPAFSYRRFFVYMFDAFYQSLALFFLIMGACDGDTVDEKGQNWGFGEISVVLAIFGTLHANMFVIVSMRSWNWISLILMSVVMLILVLFALSYAAAKTSLVPGLFEILYARSTFWLEIPLQLVVCNLPRIVFLFCYRLFYPTNIHIMQELSVEGKGHVPSELRRASLWMTEKRKSISKRASNWGLSSQLLADGMSPSASVQFESPASRASRVKKEDYLVIDTINPAIPRTDSTKGSPQPPSPEPPKKMHPFPLQVDTRVVQSEYSMPMYESTGALTIGTIGSAQTVGTYLMSSELRTPFSPMRPSSLNEADDIVSSKGGLTVMKTGEMMRNRGFSFSQSPGARDVIMGVKRKPVVGERGMSSPLSNIMERSSTVQMTSPQRSVKSPLNKEGKKLMRNNTMF
ncbi:phospholipid transporting ATPase [Rhizoclosmatium hyalinum]|nr:phospholipid transporting ATPase [Rhizoclosmatium hyalinum]